MNEPIVLPSLGVPFDELWEVLVDVAERADVTWVLIGGQMVLLHALDHGVTPPQISLDGDVLADIRADPAGLLRLVAVLEELGFESDGMAPGGEAHRYRRESTDPQRPVLIDVLAPEGVGAEPISRPRRPAGRYRSREARRRSPGQRRGPSRSASASG